MRTREYAVVTAGYWAFTLTDGALRMLVLLRFHELGYSPVSLAFLFLLYEAMGVATNLFGGRIAARTGLGRTLTIGLALQTAVLATLTLHDDTWSRVASVVFVMGLQALSGVAKDLTKLSSKSSVRFVSGADGNRLFTLVAALTGSKNALKGVGFFVGAALLARTGYDSALWILAALVGSALVLALATLRGDTGRSAAPRSSRRLLSDVTAINQLSAARFFLFGARDIWFVVALPVFLDEALGWSFEGIGAFLAAWVIGYGMVQAGAPLITRASGDIAAARLWAIVLPLVAAAIAVIASADAVVAWSVPIGLVVFGAVFAVNSSLHSYLILAYADEAQVTREVGFYYSANAAGRLVGTLLSGVLALAGGFALSLWGTVAFTTIAALLTTRLPTPAVSRSRPRAAEPSEGRL